ncbi:MAG: diacylglycerol kinase family protein [Zetaproteobacteria bacterium]|nr:diacylglycerol kinase family protein [Zetaproteobacteria bacterium]
MPGVGIIANPHSKLNRKNPKRQELLGYIAGSKGHLRITQNLKELDDAMQYFLKENIEILAISGGDGTISKTLTAMYHCYKGKAPLPKIAVLGGGTINTLAQNLKCKARPEYNLYHLLQLHSSQSPLTEHRLSSLKISNNIGFLYADGVSAHFLEIFYRKKTNGWGAFWLIARILASGVVNGRLFRSVVRAQMARICCNNSKYREKYSHVTSVLVSTIWKMPLGFRTFRLVKDQLGLHQTLVSNFSPRELLVAFLFYFLLLPQSSHPKKHTFLASALQLEYERPFLYTLDGELYKSADRSLNIDIGPEFTFVLA